MKSKHSNRSLGVGRHLMWQLRKMLNLFPFEQSISSSRIIATDKYCGVSALINSMGMYDFDNMMFVKQFLLKGGTFIDIGANIGSYTLIASESPTAQVYSFEPHPETFRKLQNNVRLNLRTNVQMCNKALSDRTGLVSFTSFESTSVNRIADSSESNTLRVESTTLEDYCDLHGVKPDFVKIDVEGFEYDVLCGAGKYFKVIQLILVEMNGLSEIRSKGRLELMNLLQSHEFKGPFLVDFDHRELRTVSESSSADAIFVSPFFASRLVNELHFEFC